MTTKPYSELYGLVEALCGCTFATQEATRVKYFINRRARIAYDESEFWPRFYRVGEERIVSEDGLLPYAQTGLDEIGTVLRIHASEPFKTTVAAEYGDFYADSTGIQITGYTAKEISSYDGVNQILVSGAGTNPDVDGLVLYYAGLDTNGYDFWSSDGELSYNSGYWYYLTYLYGGLEIWNLTWNFPGLDPLTRGWADSTRSDPGYVSPSDPLDIALWTDLAVGDSTLTISRNTVYSAYITYKAALTDTYGDADGETADVPAEWFDYIAHGAYSDFMRNDQQQDRAALAEQEAETILIKQLEKIGRQNGSSVYTRVISNANTQWR